MPLRLVHSVPNGGITFDAGSIAGIRDCTRRCAESCAGFRSGVKPLLQPGVTRGIGSVFLLGYMAGGIVAWSLVPAEWPLSFAETLAASIDSSTYGHPLSTTPRASWS
jgi:hypothetical protein